MERLVVPLGLAILGGLVAAGCTDSDAPAPDLPAGDPTRPDLVLVSVDTLRADHLSCYGYDRPTSPFLDSLAREGIRFGHARSPSPWTLPAHVTMLSGRLSPRHGVVDDDARMAPDLPRISSVLQEAGYQTVGVAATLFVSEKFGFEVGFEHFEDFGIHDSRTNLSGEVTASHVVDEALDRLGALEAGRPAFFFVHVYDVHYEYRPPAPFDTMFDRAPREDDRPFRNYAYNARHPLSPEQLAHQVAQYDEAIRYVDTELARLHAAFEEAGRESTWLVTADHGEEFGERGSWGHAHTLHPEQLHVPFILWGADIPTRSDPVETPVGLEDIAPTLAALAAVEIPGPDGMDLTGVLRGDPLPERSFFATTTRFRTRRFGLFERGWRLDVDLARGQRALYHAARDPTESRDLSTARPDRVRTLEQDLWSRVGQPWGAREALALRTRGWFLHDGDLHEDHYRTAAGTRFQVLPFDAEIRAPGTDRTWRALGDSRPEPGDPLFHDAETTAGAATLDAADRERLEALGYLQEDPDADEAHEPQISGGQDPAAGSTDRK